MGSLLAIAASIFAAVAFIKYGIVCMAEGLKITENRDLVGPAADVLGIVLILVGLAIPVAVIWYLRNA